MSADSQRDFRRKGDEDGGYRAKVGGRAVEGDSIIRGKVDTAGVGFG